MFERPVVVFDTGPLRHFALHGWLEILHFVFEDRRIVIPETVEREIKRQASDDEPALATILGSPWIEVVRSDDLKLITVQARYEDLLRGDGGENLGECGVLALGEAMGWEVVIDDWVPRQLGEANGLEVTTTLQILFEAIREGRLTYPLVEHIVDDLVTTYRLPFEPGGLRVWAAENGLIDY